ncbi:MAG: Gfo/Idh/MocA family protein [Acidobacteriota bacterium]
MIAGAIIGLGKIAQTAHLPAFINELLRMRCTICAAAEPDERIRNVAKVKYPWLRLYASAEELFERERPGFVDICTPPNLHSYMIRLAVEHQAHVLCEKPFTPDVNEAQRLAHELKQHPELVFMPCHQYVYSPLWRALKAFIAESAPAEQVFIQSSVFRTAADPGIASDGRGWRRNWAVSGGGILADTGVHYIALDEWMLGMPDDVSCRTYRLDRIKEGVVEDTAAVELKHPGGVFQFSLTWAADRRANMLHAVTPRRSFVYDGSMKALQYEDGSCRRIIGVPDPSDKTQYIGLYEQLFTSFLSMIERGDADGVGVDSALHAAMVTDAAYRSAETGSIVRIGELV